jgi:hypothetical protein
MVTRIMAASGLAAEREIPLASCRGAVLHLPCPEPRRRVWIVYVHESFTNVLDELRAVAERGAMVAARGYLC